MSGSVKISSLKRGFTLVELVLALALTGIVTGLMGALTVAINNQVVTNSNYYYYTKDIKSIDGFISTWISLFDEPDFVFEAFDTELYSTLHAVNKTDGSEYLLTYSFDGNIELGRITGEYARDGEKASSGVYDITQITYISFQTEGSLIRVTIQFGAENKYIVLLYSRKTVSTT